MFPLKTRKVGGYEYAEKTFYSAHHLGTDYSAKTGTPLYAPFDGVVEKIMTGEQGGKTIWFRPDNANVLMRFMHLDEFRCKVGKVVEGAIIALTGNTGKMTKAPHLHLDISKGYLKLGDISNFLDPEKYKWDNNMSIQGIDLSHWNGISDWKAISKNVKFAILKATQGLSYVDPTFIDKRASCRQKGILVGHYHFADGNDVKKECDHFLKTVGEMMEGELLALDYEIQLADPVSWCKKFLDRCYEKTGIRPLIYINQATLNKFDWKPCKDYGLWIARYGAEPVLKDFPFIAIHQFSSKGKVDGIIGSVDMNTAFMSLETLKGYGKSKPVEEEKIDIPINVPQEEENLVAVPNIAPTNEPVEQQEQVKLSFWTNLINLIIKLWTQKQ